MITRRFFLKILGLMGVSTVTAVPDVAVAKAELPFIKVEFNENGNVSNHKILMEGVPFVKQDRNEFGNPLRLHYLRHEQECWKRETYVWVEEFDAISLSPVTRWWGKGKLVEWLDSHERMNSDENGSYRETAIGFWIKPTKESYLSDARHATGTAEDKDEYYRQAKEQTG